MFTMNIYFIFLNLALTSAAEVYPKFVQDLLSASEHETRLTEDVAKLFEIEYERSCDSEVASACCTSCAYDGTCNNGGYCCESSKVRTKMLKLGENECPNNWESDCKLTKMIPIEGCDSTTKHNHGASHNLDSSSDSSSSEDRSGLRVMCLCLQTRRCCSGFIPISPTDTTSTSTSSAATWWYQTTSTPATTAESTIPETTWWWYQTTGGPYFIRK